MGWVQNWPEVFSQLAKIVLRAAGIGEESLHFIPQTVARQWTVQEMDRGLLASPKRMSRGILTFVLFTGPVKKAPLPKIPIPSRQILRPRNSVTHVPKEKGTEIKITEKNVTRNTYICAVHWPGEKGPTSENSDPLKANLTPAQLCNARP